MEWLNGSNHEDSRERSLREEEATLERRIGVQLSPERDLPLLLHVRNSTFVSHDQLFRWMVEAGLEHNRRAFNWRIRRLIKGAHVRETPAIEPYKGAVYSISRFGLGILESCGEGLVSVTSESRNLPSILQGAHFLELNEICDAFRRTRKLKSWKLKEPFAAETKATVSVSKVIK